MNYPPTALRPPPSRKKNMSKPNPGQIPELSPECKNTLHICVQKKNDLHQFHVRHMSGQGNQFFTGRSYFANCQSVRQFEETSNRDKIISSDPIILLAFANTLYLNDIHQSHKVENLYLLYRPSFPVQSVQIMYRCTFLLQHALKSALYKNKRVTEID